MEWNSQLLGLSTGVLALAGVIVMQGAFAAPPLRAQLQGTQLQPRPQMPAQVRQPQASALSLQRQLDLRGQLDLRAPAHLPEVAENDLDRSFPSKRPNLAVQDAVQLPRLGAEGIRARPTVQEFVRRVRQEGLPVARLFEGKSALVHLGLNPKGKPGLWLVQKTH